MSKPIKVGVVGLGRIGMSVHLDCLKARPDKFQVVAACDLIPERCEKYAAVFNCKTYTSLEEMIADPEVEVVDIATRSCDHYAHSKMALLAGKSVLVEKPFCRTYEEAKELIRLGSQPSGPRIFVRHNRRFEEGFLKVNEIIDSGILGEVFEIKLTRNEYQRRNDWQTIKEFGGGQLLNWGPHIVDHSLQFCGGKYESMFADIKRVAAVGDAEDHIKLVFKGVNHRVVDMEISGGAALPTPEYVVYGTKGSLIGDGQTLRWTYLDPDVSLRISRQILPLRTATPSETMRYCSGKRIPTYLAVTRRMSSGTISMKPTATTSLILSPRIRLQKWSVYWKKPRSVPNLQTEEEDK